MALSGITDAYGKGTEHVEKMRATTKIVASMLRTWSGKIDILLFWVVLAEHSFRVALFLCPR